MNKGLLIAWGVKMPQPWTKAQLETLLGSLGVSPKQLGHDIHALVHMRLLQELRTPYGAETWLYMASEELLAMELEEIVRRCRESHEQE